MPKLRRKPVYSLHAATGQARVRIDGKDCYLGVYGSQESRERYDDLTAAWLAKQDVKGLRLAVDDLALLYLEHCDTYYRKDGRLTGEADNIRRALRPLIALFGRTRAREFGPAGLLKVRERMIRDGFVRRAINIHVSRIRRMFKWAVERELLPVTTWQSLCAVSGLSKGRSTAKESTPVPPVAEGTVSETLLHLPPVVADMVRLQLFCGMRPGEICVLRPCDVTRGTNGVWTYRPASHKTEHHGRERRIFIGPQGQAILRRYLDRDAEAFCFTPAESEAERNAERKRNRRSPMTPSHATRKPRGRRLRHRYTKDSYNRAVQRACEQAYGMPMELRDVGRTVAKMTEATKTERETTRELLSAQAAEWRRKFCWSPNQLRHSAATAIRERYGIEAAQTVLGHSDPKVTEIYAERDFAMAANVMREIG